MKAIDLAKAILELPGEQQQLEIMSIEEIWAFSCQAPRLAMIDEEGIECDDGELIILI